MAACVTCLRNNGREAIVRERVGHLRGSLEINNIMPCSCSMNFRCKYERNGEKLQCFEQRRSKEQVFVSLVK